MQTEITHSLVRSVLSVDLMPNHTCCVPGCNNRHTKTKEKGIKYYKFPQDKTVRRLWLTRISRERTFTVTANTRICSEHFEGGKKDDKNSLPSIFPWKNPPTKKPGRLLPSKRVAISPTPTPTIKRLSVDPVVQLTDLNTSVGSETSIVQSIAFQCSPDVAEMAVQCESERMLVPTLVDQIERLEAQCASLQAQLISHTCTFCIDRFAENDHDVAYYTGFPTYDMLMIFWRYLGEKVNHLTHWRGKETNLKGMPSSVLDRKLKPLDEFLLCLMRLRLGLQIKDLAFRFNISPASVSRIFTTWINFLYLEFKAIDFQPSREQVDRDMLVCFKWKYPSTRLILDASEIHIETPSSLEMQSNTWSSYKNTNTLKCLIGITPTGYISFVSSLYCGNISDKRLTIESGVLDTLQPGDGLMADRGFDIGDDCASRNIHLNIPPFRYGRGQLSASEVIQTRRIASLRIHVERAIGQIKRYRILDSCIPISMCVTLNQVFYVCCMLTKFQPPLVT